jgi:hypothetical protein
MGSDEAKNDAPPSQSEEAATPYLPSKRQKGVEDAANAVQIPGLSAELQDILIREDRMARMEREFGCLSRRSQTKDTDQNSPVSDMEKRKRAFGCLAKRPQTRALGNSPVADSVSIAELSRPSDLLPGEMKTQPYSQKASAFGSLLSRPKSKVTDPLGIETRAEVLRYLKKDGGASLLQRARELLPNFKSSGILSSLTDALFALLRKA